MVVVAMVVYGWLVGGGRVVARRKNNDQTPTPAVASRMHAPRGGQEIIPS